MSLLNTALNTVWAMPEPQLRRLLEVVAREQSDKDLAATLRDARQARRDAVLTADGRPLDGAHDVQIRDGVAVMPIYGSIFRHANLLTMYSGGATIETLAKDFALALNSPSVRAIVLDIDSPGGEVRGVSEFAQMIEAARGVKPVVAYVGDLAASAAYWIASAASEIVMADTASVGSIGVVATMPHPDGRPIRDVEIVSSASPKKRPNIATEAGRAQVQTWIDDTADVFVTAVARHRGVSAETVLADYGQGDILIASRAIAAGMADRIDTLEATITRLGMTASTQQRGTYAMADAPTTTTATDPTLQTLLNQPTPAEAQQLDALQARIVELEGIQARAAEAALTATAAAFADGLVASGRIAPAAADHATALYRLCADAGQPAVLTAFVEALPAKAVRTGEQVLGTALPLDRAGDKGVTEEEQGRAAAKAYAGGK